MKLVLLGVRGSTPAPGAAYVKYGGHTSCVAVIPDGGHDPTLVLDAGTGLRSLSDRLSTPAFRGAIALTHLHWDHMQGLPFFAAGDREASAVDLYLPAQRGESAHELLARTMSPPSFPIEPGGLHGDWAFHTVDEGAVEIRGFQVTAADLAHKGGRTLGYRVEDGSGAAAYLPDHALGKGMSDAARALTEGADVLLHDAQFLESERAIADEFGHATVDDAIRLAAESAVGLLVLFHHSPSRTDDELDALAAGVNSPVPVVVAREGQTLAVPAGGRAS